MNNKGKNFIIAFLMILAIYQTAELWFGGFSSHNFFSFPNKSVSAKYNGDVSHTLERIIINLGDNKMLWRENGIYNSSYKGFADDAITKLLRRGESVSEGTVDWKSILQNKCFIYEYSYTLSSAEAEKFFDVSNSNTGKIKSFDTIVLSDETNGTRLSFINSKTLWGVSFFMNDNSVASGINDLFNGFRAADDDIYCISSMQNGFNIFKNNIFIPRWDGENVRYPYVSAQLQYSLDKTEALEREANQFFDNPAAKWSSSTGSAINYSDESTVVKYNKNGVLEYSNYSTGSKADENDFYTNYIACLTMLERDAGITNEFYLRNYKLSGSQYTMYFGYKANNLPIIMSDELKKSLKMDDYIEITADYGRISRYRRYCTAYSLESARSMVADNDFLKAVDDVYSELDSQELKVDELSLSYMDKGDDEKMQLWWQISVDGKNYLRSIKKEAGE